MLRELAKGRLRIGKYEIGIPPLNGESTRPASYQSGASKSDALDRLLKYVTKRSADVRFVDDEKAVASHGNWIGSRYGDQIKVSLTRNGEPFSRNELGANVLHEYAAGHDHKRTDGEAQEEAYKLASELFPELAPHVQRVTQGLRNEGLLN